MGPIYKVTDIDENFYESTINRLADRYEQFVEINEYFNKDVRKSIKPFIKKDPISGETKEFRYPLAYDIWIIFNFILSKLPVECDAGGSIHNIIQIKRNPLVGIQSYDIEQDKWINSKIGFLVYIARLKMKLLEEKDFSAIETGRLLGVTGQAIINRIKRDNPLEGKKDDSTNQWVISNEEVRRVVKESDSPILLRD